MNREFSFSSNHAKAFGVSGAIVLNLLINETRMLSIQNENSNGFMPFSLSSISETLCFYNNRTVRRAIDNLLIKGCIEIKHDEKGKRIGVNYDVIRRLNNDNKSKLR